MDGNTTVTQGRTTNRVVNYLLISLSLIFMFVLGYYINDSVFSIRDYLDSKKEDVVTVDEQKAEDKEVLVDENETSTEKEVVSPTYPSYIMKVGKTNFIIPDGWKISKLIAYKQELTNEEKKEMLKSDGNFSFIEGYYPIYSGATIELTNGVSVVTINNRDGMIAGPFGIEPDSLGKDWTVVQEPKAKGFGFARKLVNGIYEYKRIELCTDAMICDKYLLLEGPFGNELSFKGDKKDLTVADNIFKSYLLSPELLDLGSRR